MSRKVDVTDLVGAAEVAERLGLAHPQTVHTLRRRDPSFPEPVAALKRALVWNWPDVESWARSTGRTVEQ
jgi:predicted DNA-binding transcriptional regulator AlpA